MSEGIDIDKAKAVYKVLPGAFEEEGMDWDVLVLATGLTTEELRPIITWLDKEEGAIDIRDSGIKRAFCLECGRQHRMGSRYCLL